MERLEAGKCSDLLHGCSHWQLAEWRGFNWAERQARDEPETQTQAEAEGRGRRETEGAELAASRVVRVWAGRVGARSCNVSCWAWVSPNIGRLLSSWFLITEGDEGEKARPSASQFQN